MVKALVKQIAVAVTLFVALLAFAGGEAQAVTLKLGYLDPLTGPAALDYFRTLGELGITHILHKPHTAEALLRLMDEILHPPAGKNAAPP